MTPPLTPADVVIASYDGDLPVVMRASTSDDPALRVAALGSFLRLKALNPVRIVTFLADPDVIVRRRAAELAYRIDDSAQVIDELIAALSDDPTVAEVAAFALGEIGIEANAAAIPHLEQMALNHDDALCRESAVAALGALHSGRETILAALADKATVRRRAVIALAPFDGPDVDAALQAALDDRDWQVRQAAEDLLAD